jgi:ribosomal protein L37AE/L43A
VESECGWLQGHIEWISQQPWLQEIADDLGKMLNDAHRIVGVEKQAKYFCTKCGWPIQERDGGAWFSCSGCDQNWTRLELHRFAERKKPKTLSEIATLTSISLKTLRSFAERGHLKVVARDGKANLYDLDAVALATMNLKYKRGVRVA